VLTSYTYEVEFSFRLTKRPHRVIELTTEVSDSAGIGVALSVMARRRTLDGRVGRGQRVTVRHVWHLFVVGVGGIS
jgi:hypothetical protein